MMHDTSYTRSARIRLLLALFLGCGWLLFALPLLDFPWFYGIDSITRLYHIDRTIVWVLGNPWLPGYQILLQFIHSISDTPFAYKFANALLGSGIVTLTFLLSARYIGIWAGLTTILYFFVHYLWINIATSVYMEPLAIFCLLLACYCALTSHRALCSIAFIIASFTRPEILLAGPAILLAHLLIIGSLKRTFIVGFLYLPIASYYLYVKWRWADLFRSPGTWTPEGSLLLWEQFTSILHSSPLFAVVGAGALCSLLAIFITPSFFPHKKFTLKVLLLSLVLFYLCYLIIPPIFHASSTGGSRESIFLGLPMFFFFGVGIQYLCSFPALRGPQILSVALAVLIVHEYKNLWSPEGLGYREAASIRSALREKGYTPGKVYICMPDPTQALRDDLHSTKKRPLFVYLRLRGWSPHSYIPCVKGKRGWKHTTARTGRPLLRIYRPQSYSNEYEQELLDGVAHCVDLYKRRAIPLAKACF